MVTVDASAGDGRTGDRAARRAVLGGAVGNFMVFYELFAYGYFAVYIGQVFFDTTDPFVAFLAGFAVYAVTYAVRPVGALVLGRIADRRGRRPVLLGTMIVICVATTLIGALPTYGQVGVLAPVLLVVLRVIQGFAASGEFGGAVTLMAEFAPPHRRGLYASWQSFTIGLAIVASSALATSLTSVLTEPQLLAWGWRVPFLLAAVFGVVAVYLRAQIDETPVFQQMQQGSGAPAMEQGRRQPLRFAVPTWVLVPFIAGALLAWQTGGTVFLQVLPSYAIATMAIGSFTAQMLTLVAAAMFTVAIPIAGWMSDRVGRQQVMMVGAVLIGGLSYPLFVVINAGSLTLAYVCVAVAGAAVGMLAGPGPAMLTELFPAHARATGVGVGFNVAEAAFGGAAGLIIGGFQAMTGDPISAAFYPIIGGIVSIVCLSLLRSTKTTAPLPAKAEK